MKLHAVPGILLACAVLAGSARAELLDEVTHGTVDSGGVAIHYATVGPQGPAGDDASLVVMIHGFPDYWYTWREQMQGLRDAYRVVAIDQRGYNLSGKPAGEASYAMNLLVEDVAAVIRHFGRERAVVVGHDWGGAVAWSFAFAHPEMLERLVILNLPHPAGLARERATSADARSGTAYVEVFRNGHPDDPDVLFGGPMNPDTLSAWVRDDAARVHYREAMARSDFAAMLAYYKVNYPPLPPEGAPPAAPPAIPPVRVPVLMFHGLADTALPKGALAGTWDWVDADLTLVTVPGAGHFVQQDAAALVTATLRGWLDQRR